MTVSDGDLIATTSFVLTVISVNDAPTISTVTNKSTNEDTATSPIAFTVGDVETAAGSLTSRLAAAGNAMSDAQTLTAEISRYLAAMGIDAEVWLRALETPPDKLTYFSPAELTGLKLATRLTK